PARRQRHRSDLHHHRVDGKATRSPARVGSASSNGRLPCGYTFRGGPRDAERTAAWISPGLEGDRFRRRRERGGGVPLGRKSNGSTAGARSRTLRRQVNVIAAPTASSALAVKALTTTIPIVFLAPEDPVRFGLVAGLARPGSNLTGVNLFTGELSAKRLEILREMV